jgi:hypothetical protein
VLAQYEHGRRPLGLRQWLGLDEPSSAGGTRLASSADDLNVNVVRERTEAAAGQSLDTSYITKEFLGKWIGADYASEGAQSFEGSAADAVIGTYGGPPIGRLSVYYGHRAALIDDVTWLFHAVTYQDGEWKMKQTVLKGYGEARIVGRCDDGSPLWEFRI